jgi:hypothetical protein
MSLQSAFEKFNDKIRTDFDVKKELKDKRDILLNKLRDDDELSSFTEFNQGSYAMYTGIEPEDGQEYDIDVALIFSANKDDYEPMKIKERIYNILKHHTDYGAEIKKPCVTVTYKRDGEAAFHVDLVTYLYQKKDDTNSQLYMAKGDNEDKNSQKWERADPKGLVNYIKDGVVVGKKREQFRRIVRYLKKWKNRRFTNTRHANPPSIGITLIAMDNFTFYEENDLEALIGVVNHIREQFTWVGRSDTGRDLYRIYFYLPDSLKFECNSDVFSKMNDFQMTDFKDKTQKLYDDLIEARDEVDEQEQYKKLNKIFGDDFEMPKEADSAKKQFNYIPSSSTSGIN